MEFSDFQKSHSQENKGDNCETATSDKLITTTNHFTALSNLEVNNADPL